MRRLLPGLVLLLPALAWLAHADDAAAEGGKEVPPIHDKSVVEAAVGIRAMYLREDHEAIRPALARLEQSCRRLSVEDKLTYGAQVVSYDLGLHRALDRTRELAADGMWTESEGQFEWVLRTCTRCHQSARDAGFGPPQPLP